MARDELRDEGHQADEWGWFVYGEGEVGASGEHAAGTGGSQSERGPRYGGGLQRSPSSHDDVFVKPHGRKSSRLARNAPALLYRVFASWWFPNLLLESLVKLDLSRHLMLRYSMSTTAGLLSRLPVNCARGQIRATTARSSDG